MELKDIKTGMLVRTGDNLLRLVLGNTLVSLNDAGGGAYLPNTNMEHVGPPSRWIKQVFSEPYDKGGTNLGGSMGFWIKDESLLTKTTSKLLWEYRESVDMTLEEVSKALGKNVRIIDGVN